MGQNNFIDVIIPVYNGQDYILRALRSVESQSLLPNKIIVVDDGSIDNTANIIKQFQASSRVPVVYYHKENGGLSSARNFGIQKSDGEFLAFLDADDEWYPQKLEKQAGVFAQNRYSDLVLVYCRYCVIDAEGREIPGYYILPPDPKIRGRVFEGLLKANKICGSGSAVLIKREVFNKVGFFDESFTAFEDWDMWLRIAEAGEIDYVDQTLVKIRRHGQNMTKKKLGMLNSELVFYNKWVPRLIGNYKIPREWPEHLAYLTWRRLPKLDFLGIINSSLDRKTKNQLFKPALGSVGLYILCYPFIALFDLICHPSLLKKGLKKLWTN